MELESCKVRNKILPQAWMILEVVSSPEPEGEGLIKLTPWFQSLETSKGKPIEPIGTSGLPKHVVRVVVSCCVGSNLLHSNTNTP